MHTPSPAWSWFSKLLKPFYWLALKTATGKSKKTWVYGRISEENWLKSEHEIPSNANHLCVVRAKRESLSPTWQLTHLHLATSPIARNHGTKARTGSKPLQECFTLRSGSGRWGTYYAGQLSKVLLPLVVLKREGSASLPPVPTRAWALPGTGRQTHAPVPAGRKALGSLTRACSCSSDERVTEIHCKAVKKNLQQNNKTLKHAVHGECSEYNYFIRTMTQKVKL